MIIVFFAGLIIMVSGGTLGDMCNVSYISLLCNVCGGAMMCSSAFYFAAKEQKEKEEIKTNHEQLSLLVENQRNLIECDNQIAEALKTQIEVLIGQVCRISENYSVDVNRVLESIRGVERGTKNEGDAIIKILNSILAEIGESKSKAEMLHKDNEEIIKCTNQLIEEEQKTYIISDTLLSQIGEIRTVTKDTAGVIKEVKGGIDNLNQMPGMIADSVDSFDKKFNEAIEKIQTELRHLIEDVKEEEKKRIEKFDSEICDIMEALEENNEEMTGEIKKLAEQYEQFEKIISGIVEQMSNMAKEDIEVMKGFLNG